mmetsp:Transcript_38651/g.91594  ORF Transcript_38651/g.91594 Transcript_38651/m.91594 type:complete len:280 (-) Transcript_38651:55-894(-)
MGRTACKSRASACFPDDLRLRQQICARVGMRFVCLGRFPLSSFNCSIFQREALSCARVPSPSGPAADKARPGDRQRLRLLSAPRPEGEPGGLRDGLRRVGDSAAAPEGRSGQGGHLPVAAGHLCCRRGGARSPGPDAAAARGRLPTGFHALRGSAGQHAGSPDGCTRGAAPGRPLAVPRLRAVRHVPAQVPSRAASGGEALPPPGRDAELLLHRRGPHGPRGGGRLPHRRGELCVRAGKEPEEGPGDGPRLCPRRLQEGGKAGGRGRRLTEEQWARRHR